MKRRIYLIIKIAVILIGFIFLTTWYSENINTIKIVENIKQAIIEQKNVENNITTIDVTNIKIGKETEHEHIYKIKYDDNKHWEECKVCEEKRNIISHTLKTTWALGYESCAPNNSSTSVCECGYFKTGYRPCVWDGKTFYKDHTLRIHGRLCIICNNYIEKDYYLYSYKNGELQDCRFESGENHQACYVANGNQISCQDIGTCAICGQVYKDGEQVHRLRLKNRKITCIICGKEFGTDTYTITTDKNTPPTYTITQHILLSNGATFGDNAGIYSPYGTGNVFENSKQEVSKNSNTDIIRTTKLKLKSEIKNRQWVAIDNYININGKANLYEIFEFNLYSDIIKPEILNISPNNINENWKKIEKISISGAENWCETVKIEILDDESKEVYIGSSNVVDGKYSIICTPELEAGSEGRTFKAIVTDSCNNSTEQEFIMAKVDNIPPKPTSSNIITGEWTKTRKFTFTAIDKGIGNVQIAFNNVNDYKLAQKNGEDYSRDYQFVGDAYEPVKARVFYKDELGNIASQEVAIDKIDNTSPTITNVSIYNNILKVEANDRHLVLGEGSGVSKYRYVTATSQIENPVISNEDSIEVKFGEDIEIQNIYKVKYIYIIAVDNVGNISEVYEFKVPELKLMATANPNTLNGKGEIILDWSGYDISDKYFVIYRKKENQEYWETIVSLDQKLTESTYTDILANDETKPNKPNITITGNTENNNINIVPTAIDIGTKYTYYIEAYDSTGILLSKSN